MGSRSRYRDKEICGMSGKEKKERRICGKNYWLLHDMGEKLGKAQEKYQEWIRKAARKHNCYADQLENSLTGKVVDDNGKIIRLGDKFINEAEKEFKKLNVIAKEVGALKVKLAHEYDTWPDLIDIKTGRISDAEVSEAEIVATEKKPEEKPKE